MAGSAFYIDQDDTITVEPRADGGPIEITIRDNDGHGGSLLCETREAARRLHATLGEALQ